MAYILLIDDDLDVREMLTKLLQRVGHTVLAAGNGAQAVAVFEKQSPDLIITDMFMPEVEGLEAISELKQRAPGIPIIAISGGWRGSNLDFLNVAESMGAARSFRKPINRDELLEAVEILLSTAEQQSADETEPAPAQNP
jgi:CheY-like chemotaxis protein